MIDVKNKSVFQVGDTVNYHAVENGEVTSSNHKIRAINLMPNNYDCDVAWISGKKGCVSFSCLSKTETVYETLEEIN